jgi:hypothetical protein
MIFTGEQKQSLQPITLMEKRVAIIQSNYIPWKGYFDIINGVDEFILFDEAQYSKNDWRNRNRIKTPVGTMWLTIPVSLKGKFGQHISETEISGNNWAQKHWKTLQQNYVKTPYFREYSPFFEELYALAAEETLLSEVNYLFLRNICDLLGIRTRLSWSSEYNLIDGKTDRLIGLCQQVGGIEYLSGPSAKDYLDESLFHNANMRVAWMDYSGYPEYRQLYPPFDHAVSIVDLIFNEGPNAPKFMKSFEAGSSDHT